MAGAQVHYEIFVCKSRQGAWQLLEVAQSRSRALERAKEVLAAEHEVLAVRVSKETFQAETGDFMSLKVFEAGERPTKVKEKTRAPAELPCFKPQDLYSVHARATIARLLKEQLVYWRLTAIELLHRADAIEKLEAAGTVLQHAIQKVAVAHAGSTNQPVQEVVKKLNDLVGKACERIYKDERAGRLPRLGAGGLAAVYERSKANPEADYLICAAVAQHLAGANNYREKIELILGLMKSLPPGDAGRDALLEVIDKFVSEIVAGSDSLSELMGGEADLGNTLLFMADLSLGTLGEGHKGAAPGVHHLAGEFARGKLPNARSALARRILTELKGMRRLCADSLEEELNVARLLANKMVLAVGTCLDHEELTEAFVARSKRFVTPESIEEFMVSQPDPYLRIQRLVEFEENVIGAENKRVLASYIKPMLTAHTTETHFVDGPLPVLSRLTALRDLQDQIEASAFQDLNKRQLTEEVDALALKVVTKSGILDSILRKNLSSAEKAFAILRLDERGILTKGKVRHEARLAARRLAREADFRPALGEWLEGAGEGADALRARIETLKIFITLDESDPPAQVA